MPAIQSLGRILPEAFFVLCSTMTVALRALAQLITEGKVNSTIFGHSSALPHRDDDFILALLKFGTAALETTAMKGLNNEVSALSLPAQSYVELHPSSASTAAFPALTAGHESRRLTSGASGSVLTSHPSFPDITQSVPSTSDAYSNEIRTIKALPAANISEVDPMSRNPSLRKEIWRFVKALVLVWKVYVVGWLAEKSGVRRLARRQGRIGRWLRWCGVQELRDEIQPAGRQRGGVAMDLRRLVEGKSPSQSRAILADLKAAKEEERKEDEEDAEDADYSLDVAEDAESSSGESSSEEDEAEESEDDEEDGIFMPGNIRARSVTPAPLEELNSLIEEQQEAKADAEEESMASLLVAHMSISPRSTARSPMTRRRYRALMQPSVVAASSSSSSNSDLALTTAIATRRASLQSSSTARPNQDQWDDSTFRSSATCVVCCSEPRSIGESAHGGYLKLF